jgi:hypothetical protein
MSRPRMRKNTNRTALGSKQIGGSLSAQHPQAGFPTAILVFCSGWRLTRDTPP